MKKEYPALIELASDPDFAERKGQEIFDRIYERKIHEGYDDRFEFVVDLYPTPLVQQYNLRHRLPPGEVVRLTIPLPAVFYCYYQWDIDLGYHISLNKALYYDAYLPGRYYTFALNEEGIEEVRPYAEKQGLPWFIESDTYFPVKFVWWLYDHQFLTVLDDCLADLSEEQFNEELRRAVREEVRRDPEGFAKRLSVPLPPAQYAFEF